MVEQQTVLAPPHVDVQLDAQAFKKKLPTLESQGLLLRDETVELQVFPGATKASGLCNPENGLQVTQAARAFLAVGFQTVRRFLVAKIALGLFHSFGLEEGLRIDLLAKRDR